MKQTSLNSLYVCFTSFRTTVSINCKLPFLTNAALSSQLKIGLPELPVSMVGGNHAVGNSTKPEKKYRDMD